MGGVKAETAWPHSEMLWFPSPQDGRSEGAASSRQGEQTVVQPQGQGCCFQAQGTQPEPPAGQCWGWVLGHTVSRSGEQVRRPWQGGQGCGVILVIQTDDQ